MPKSCLTCKLSGQHVYKGQGRNVSSPRLRFVVHCYTTTKLTETHVKLTPCTSQIALMCATRALRSPIQSSLTCLATVNLGDRKWHCPSSLGARITHGTLSPMRQLVVCQLYGSIFVTQFPDFFCAQQWSPSAPSARPKVPSRAYPSHESRCARNIALVVLSQA